MPQFMEEKEAIGWTRQHGQRVNAGDCAPILYESPFENAYQLFLRKTGRIPKQEQTEAMRGGQETEPLIKAWYDARVGLVGQSQIWCADDNLAWIQGKADWWHPDTKRLAEFKAPQRADTADHLQAKAGAIPQHYYLQCLHLMEVFDADEMEYVSWRNPDDFAVLPVKRDPELWALVILPAYLEFYDRLKKNQWPEPSGTAINTDEEWRKYAHRILDNRAIQRAAEAEIDRATAAIKRMMTVSGRKTERGAGIRATWTTYKARWDVKIGAESSTACERILKAVRSLEGRDGVGRIERKESYPNLILRIQEDDETPEDSSV